MVTSIASAVQFIVLGRLIWDYAIWFSILGFFSSLIGLIGVNKLVKKYNKKSIIVLVIALVISLSTVLLVTIGLINLVDDIKKHIPLGFHPACAE